MKNRFILAALGYTQFLSNHTATVRHALSKRLAILSFNFKVSAPRLFTLILLTGIAAIILTTFKPQLSEELTQLSANTNNLELETEAQSQEFAETLALNENSSNPTGTTIETTELAQIVDLVRERQGFTLVDEIYQGLTYDAAPYSALALGEDVIVINSFSKYFNMTGWRLGWLVVPPTLLPAIEKLAQNMFICASSIAQHAALACFTPESLAIFESRKAEFHRRRDYIVPALRDLGFKIPVTPDGAFYVYADCSAFSNDAGAFTKDILNKTGVVVVPGLDFGSHTAGHYIRVSYSTSMSQLEEAVSRLRSYLHP